MNLKFRVLLGGLFLLLATAAPGASTEVIVPGSANPWLAGAADGTTDGADSAPAQSPVVVAVQDGDELVFTVTGTTGYESGAETTADGVLNGQNFHELEHGISNGIGGIINTPINALIGVFLDNSVPTAGGEPEALDFLNNAKAYSSKLPALRQPFFIGDGRTGNGSGAQQIIYVPEGATRLFLGTMESFGWFNHTGSYTVTVTSGGAVPGEPPVIVEETIPAPGSSFTATAGTPPYTFALQSGSLPSGLFLSEEGLITGSSSSGAYSVTIRVTDSMDLFSDKVFSDNVDVGRPEIELRRIIITDNGAGFRSAKFEVGATDDFALVPADPLGFIANVSHSLEIRHRIGSAAFGEWTEWPYYPGNLPPAVVNFMQNDKVQVELRSVDWAGNRSLPLAYEISKPAITPEPDKTLQFELPVSIPDVGQRIVKLFGDVDFDGDGRADILSADGDTGKITLARNTNAKVAGIKHTQIIIPAPAVIQDVATGLLLPIKSSDRVDAKPDLVVATGTHLRILRGNAPASPAFKLLGRAEEDLTFEGRVFSQVGVGDLDGDSADDIVAIAVEEDSCKLVVFYNQAGSSSSAGFKPPVELPVAADMLYTLAVGDINGDGLADIVAAGPADDSAEGSHSMYCWLGQYEGDPVSVPEATVIGQPIIDLKIAAYTGHLAGQKDVIAATLETADEAYPGTTHLVRHRVLVHQGQGVFAQAASRRLSTVTQAGVLSPEDRDLCSLAIGDVTGDGAPEILGNQFDTTTGGSADTGFLPPASETGELNWMETNDNGVVTFGTVTGKTRRVALFDLDKNGVNDVLLANADSGTIDLLLNSKSVGAVIPKGVKPLVSPLQPLSPVMKPLVSAPPGQGVANSPWVFGCKLGTSAVSAVPNVQVWAQYQRDNGPWLNLPGGLLGQVGKLAFGTVVTSVPEGYVRFRILVEASVSGLNPAASAPSSYYRTRMGNDLEVTLTPEPDSSQQDNLFTHDDEVITYRLRYRNTGNVTAQDVVVAGAVPLNTKFDGGGSSGFNKDTPTTFNEKAKVIWWTVGNLAPGESGEKFYFVRVDAGAEKKLKGKKPIIINTATDSQLSKSAFGQAAFLTQMATGRSFGIYSGPPAPGFLGTALTGPAATTPVVPPLTLIQTVDTNNIAPGGLANVEIILRNYGAKRVDSIEVTDIVEPHFVVEGVRLRTPGNAVTGNFDGLLDTNPGAAFNPSFRQTGIVPLNSTTLVWNVGSLEGVRNALNQLQPPGEVRMRYQVRLKANVDSLTYLDNSFQPNSITYGGLGATGLLAGKATAARTDILPKTSSVVAALEGYSPPQLSLIQDLIPLQGLDGATAQEPLTRREIRVGFEDMAAVNENGLLRVKLRYRNHGGTAALRSVLNYRLPPNTQYLGFLRKDGVSVTNAATYQIYDAKDILIPSANEAARGRETSRISFILGNLAASPAIGSEGVIDFILQALPMKTAAQKSKPVTYSKGATMFSDSVVGIFYGTPSAVPVAITRPVAFEIEAEPGSLQLERQSGVEQTLRYRYHFRNTGWEPAFEVKINADIPVGTEFVSANLLSVDNLGVISSGVRNGSTVSFNVGNMTADDPNELEQPSGSHGLAELVLRVPANLPSNFPKDGRIRQSVGITGRDVGGKTSQGSFRKLQSTSENVALIMAAAQSLVTVIDKTSPDFAPGQLVAGKCVPMFAKAGQVLPIQLFAANSGGQPIENVVIAIQVPWGTELVTEGTTAGFKKSSDKDEVTGASNPNVLRWTLGTINGHDVKGINLAVRVLSNAGYEGKYIFENSCVMTGQIGKVTVERVPGNARTLVQSTQPEGGIFGWFGAMLQGIGANLFGSSTPEIDTSIQGFSRESFLTCVSGADVYNLTNGAFIIPLQGGRIVAGGAGNLIANDGASIVAGGAGNIVAGGAGNIVAGGAGNLISVTGVGACTTTNLNALTASIVAGGAGNIVAAGAGNLIANDGASLIANDGASLGPVFTQGAGIVAGGAGNIVAGGAGNIVAAGGGNIVAGGAGNFVRDLLSTKPGTSLIVNGGAALAVQGLVSTGGSSLLANDGASLIGKNPGALGQAISASVGARDTETLITK